MQCMSLIQLNSMDCLDSAGSPLLRPLFRSGVTCSSTASRRSSSSNSNSASASANGNANANANANTTNSSTPLNHSRWRRLWRPFIWLQFTFGLGFLAIVLKNYKRQKTHPSQSPELIVKDWEVNSSRFLFDALIRLLVSKQHVWFKSLP